MDSEKETGTEPTDDSAEIARLTEEIHRLKEEIDSSYYSIPKREFEKITVQSITNKVTEQLNKRVTAITSLLGTIVVLASLFGFSAIKQVSVSVEKKISDSLVSEIDTQFDQVSAQLDNKIQAVTLNLEALQRRLNDETKIRQNLLDQGLLDIYLERFAKIKEQVVQPGTDEALKDHRLVINNMLPDVLNLGNESLSEKYLELLFRINFELRDYEQMDLDKEKYSDDYQFNELTWVTISIADTVLYRESGSQLYVERAQEAIDQSLNLLPNYGEPLAVQLILNTEQILKQQPASMQSDLHAGIESVFKQLNSGTNTITSYEAYSYVLKSENTVFDEALDYLWQNFSEQMTTVEGRYQQYLNP